MHIRIALIAALIGPMAPAFATQDAPPPVQGTDLSGLHSFDARVGCWTGKNHVLKERLAGSHEWMDYPSKQHHWLVMGGYGNVTENWYDKPGGAYHLLTVRTYDAKTGQWNIWGFDSRYPSDNVDPPTRGRFDSSSGVGTFYSDDTLRGKPVRVRFTWSSVSTTQAHWEQAYSPDGGKTWETNWVADFQKAACDTL